MIENRIGIGITFLLLAGVVGYFYPIYGLYFLILSCTCMILDKLDEILERKQ